MVLIMASYEASPSSSGVEDCDIKINKQYLNSSDDLKVIRSVAMSANVAFAVADEVKHFIHVNSLEIESLQGGEFSTGVVINSNNGFASTEEESTRCYISRQEHEHDYICSLMSSCSFGLPFEDEAIISAVVISKWDDVIGPQTVHAWLKSDLKCDDRTCKSESAFKTTFNNSAASISHSSVCCSCGFSDVSTENGERGSEMLHHMYFYKKRLKVLKAIKYITSHTVNYSSGNILIGEKPSERNISVFMVPELDLVAQCIVFQLRDGERRIPYSIALLSNYLSCNSCLQLSHYCRHWLQQSSFLIQEIFVQCAESKRNFEVTEEVNVLVMELCSRMTTLSSLQMTSLNASYYSGVLYSHFLPYALTSHLQTFGCSVVSGTSIHYMNMLIAFLSLFLENSEKACSCFVKSTQKFTFHHGLFLQGMLTNSSGFEDNNLWTFGKHLDAITSINIVSDIEMDAVRQPLFHSLYLAHLHNNLHEQVIVRNSFERVKQSASLVNCFLSDMSKLPSTHWNAIIYMFKKKLYIFGRMLLTLVSTLRESDYRSKLLFRGDLCERMGICGADLLIILAVAEKLKPGTYNYIIECDNTFT